MQIARLFAMTTVLPIIDLTRDKSGPTILYIFDAVVNFNVMSIKDGEFSNFTLFIYSQRQQKNNLVPNQRKQ